jgi:hypothetical protein
MNHRPNAALDLISQDRDEPFGHGHGERIVPQPTEPLPPPPEPFRPPPPDWEAEARERARRERGPVAAVSEEIPARPTRPPARREPVTPTWSLDQMRPGPR